MRPTGDRNPSRIAGGLASVAARDRATLVADATCGSGLVVMVIASSCGIGPPWEGDDLLSLFHQLNAAGISVGKTSVSVVYIPAFMQWVSQHLATTAPVLSSAIADVHGWRWVFAASPILAGIWLIGWLWLYRRPSEHPRITDRERAYLEANLEKPEPAGETRESEVAMWKRMLSDSAVWRLILARMLTDPVWYFYQFWMPKYLYSIRKLNQEELSIMWMVFLAADIGFLASGFLSGWMIKRGRSPASARLVIMLSSACIVPMSFLVPSMQSVMSVMVIGMFIAYAHTAWLGNLTSLVVDIMPKRNLGTAFGVIACGSTLGGMMMNKLVATFVSPEPLVLPTFLEWINAHRSYDTLFYLMACLHPLGILLVWKLRKRAVVA